MFYFELFGLMVPSSVDCLLLWLSASVPALVVNGWTLEDPKWLGTLVATLPYQRSLRVLPFVVEPAASFTFAIHPRPMPVHYSSFLCIEHDAIIPPFMSVAPSLLLGVPCFIVVLFALLQRELGAKKSCPPPRPPIHPPHPSVRGSMNFTRILYPSFAPEPLSLAAASPLVAMAWLCIAHGIACI